MSSDINVSVDHFLSMPFVGQWATHPFYMHVFMGISTTAILNRPSKPCLSPNYSNGKKCMNSQNHGRTSIFH